MGATENEFCYYEDGMQSKIDVAAAEVIYDNTPVGLNGSGAGRALVAGDIYGGWNKSGQVDNSSGSAGGKKVTVERDAYPQLPVTGVASEEDRGKAVYATADNAFTLTPPAPGSGTRIGKVFRFVSSGVAVVHAFIGADGDDDVQGGKVATTATITTAGAGTYTATQLLGGIIDRDPNGGDRTDTTATAAAIVAAIDNAVVGSIFEVVVENAANADEVITLAGGAGVTLGPTAQKVFYKETAKFLGILTNVTAGAEAVTIRKVGITEIQTDHLKADIIDSTRIADDAVSLEHLDSGITPSHIVVYAGEFTWSGGGTSKAQTVAGALATDVVVGSIQTVPSEAAYLVSLAVTDNTVTATLSAANTTNDGVISYAVYRPAA